MVRAAFSTTASPSNISAEPTSAGYLVAASYADHRAHRTLVFAGEVTAQGTWVAPPTELSRERGSLRRSVLVSRGERPFVAYEHESGVRLVSFSNGVVAATITVAPPVRRASVTLRAAPWGVQALWRSGTRVWLQPLAIDSVPGAAIALDLPRGSAVLDAATNEQARTLLLLRTRARTPELAWALADGRTEHLRSEPFSCVRERCANPSLVAAGRGFVVGWSVHRVRDGLLPFLGRSLDERGRVREREPLTFLPVQRGVLTASPGGAPRLLQLGRPCVLRGVRPVAVPSITEPGIFPEQVGIRSSAGALQFVTAGRNGQFAVSVLQCSD